MLTSKLTFTTTLLVTKLITRYQIRSHKETFLQRPLRYAKWYFVSYLESFTWGVGPTQTRPEFNLCPALSVSQWEENFILCVNKGNRLLFPSRRFRFERYWKVRLCCPEYIKRSWYCRRRNLIASSLEWTTKIVMLCTQRQWCCNTC